MSAVDRLSRLADEALMAALVDDGDSRSRIQGAVRLLQDEARQLQLATHDRARLDNVIALGASSTLGAALALLHFRDELLARRPNAPLSPKPLFWGVERVLHGWSSGG
jgi:hypothetical protein